MTPNISTSKTSKRRPLLRGARHKYGSSRRRRCGLSSDNLTRKEWERMQRPSTYSQARRGSFLGQVQSFAEELAAGLISSISSRSLRSDPRRSVVCSVSARPIAGTTSKNSSVSLSRDARPDRRPCASSTPIDPTEDRFAPTKKNTELTRVSLTFCGGFSPQAIAARLQGLFPTGAAVSVTVDISAVEA